MINEPQAWATIFVTQRDRRSFVEMCLERSHTVSLEVTVDARSYGPAHHTCTCTKPPEDDFFNVLTYNETNPCERHFAFESLAETKHSTRICTLNIVFDDGTFAFDEGLVPLELEGCRFFELSFPQLTDLKLDDPSPPDPDFLPISSLFPPTLRSLHFRGSSGHDQLMGLSNLTSFTFDGNGQEISVEGFRTFILNNRSLEALSLDSIELKGGSNQHPAILPNLKSFNVHYPHDYSRKNFSTVFRVPALQRLSSLLISIARDPGGTYWFMLCATGDEIVFTVECDVEHIAEAWQDLTGYAGPTIQHIHLEEPHDPDFYGDESGGVRELFTDFHRWSYAFLRTSALAFGMA